MSGPYDPNEVQPVVERLRAAFADETHDLWDGQAIYADHEHLTAVRIMKLHGMGRLTSEEIENMVRWAMAGAGGAPTFRFFLWRYLEMILTTPGPSWTVDADLMLRKLELAHFVRWPSDQQKAVEDGLGLWAAQRVMDEIMMYQEPDAGAYQLRAWIRQRHDDKADASL